MRILYAAPISKDLLKKLGNDIDKFKDNDYFLMPLFYHFWKLGNEIVIVSTDRNIKSTEFYRLERLSIYIIKMQRHGRISAFLGFRNDIRTIKKVIKTQNVDIVHAHWCYELAAACIESFPEKTIVTMHDWPDNACRLLGNFYWKRRNIMANKYIAKARCFTAVSPYIEKYVRNANPGSKIEMIPNFFVESELTKFAPEKTETFKIICVNNGFSILKNTKMSMSVFEEFHRSHPDSVMELWGDGYEKGGEAEKWAESNLSTDGMIFCGHGNRKQLINAYSKADVLLHLSMEESFGLIYLDAMASKTAIIAGKNSGATPWVLENGKSGALVEINDKEDICEKLELLYRDNSYRNRIISHGKLMLENFYSDTVYELYNRVYCEIIDA